MEYHKSCEYEKCYISPPLFHSIVIQNIRVYICIATRVLRTSRSIHGAVRKFLFLYGSICALYERGHVAVEKVREEPHCGVRQREEKIKKIFILTCVEVFVLYSASAEYKETKRDT